MSDGRQHTGDIALGGGHWLRWIDLPGNADSHVLLDPWLQGLDPLWDALETVCIHECCGIDAFDLTAGAVAAAVADAAKAGVLRRLVELGDSVAALPPNAVLSSTRLNQCFHRDLLVQLVAHLTTSLRASTR